MITDQVIKHPINHTCMMHTEEKQDGEGESVVQGEGAPLEEVPQPKGGEQEAVAGDQKEEQEGKAPTPDQVPGSSSGQRDGLAQ